MIRKWNIVNDQSRTNYNAGNEIMDNTEFMKSNLCDNNKADILVGGDINNIRHDTTQVAFKNGASFTKCITKKNIKQIVKMKIQPMHKDIFLNQIILKLIRLFYFSWIETILLDI